MTVDENWEMPAEWVVNTMTDPLTQHQSSRTATQIEADAQLAEELDETQRRRSSRRSKLPSVAAEENERDESDGMVVGGYGPFLS